MNGFTLLELLVVTVIVSILTAIAVPQFGEYRQRAYDTQALSELRSLALGEEAYFVEEEEYLTCQNQDCTALPGIGRVSEVVSVAMTGDEQSFTGESHHQKGSGRVFQWDSALGGLQP